MENINFAKFYELSDLMMLIINDRGEFLSVNDFFYKSTGFNESEVIGHHFKDVLFELDIDIAIKEFQRVLSGEVTSSFILRLLKRNNKLLYIEFSAKIDFESNIVYAVGRDITGFLFNDSMLQDVALSVPGSIFKLRKTKNGNFEFDFLNKNVGGIFKDLKNNTFIQFIELLEEESQIEFLNQIDSAQRDFKFKSFRIVFSSEPEKIFQVNINPYRIKNDFVFYGVATLVETNPKLNNKSEIEKFKIEKIKENIGFFNFKFDSYYINDSYESQKIAYRNGVIVDCSDLFARNYQFDRKEDIIGKTIDDIIEDKQIIYDYLEDIISNEYSMLNKVTYHRESKSYFKSTVTSFIKNNKLEEIKGSFENITDSLQKQIQLEVTHQNYKNIFEFSPVGIMVHDENAILRANNVLLNYLETDESNFVGKLPTHFVLEESIQAVNDVLVKYKNNVFVTEPVIIKVRTHKGNIKEFQASPHHVEYDGKSCIEVTFVDLTNINKLQSERDKTRLLLKSVLDNSREYILRIDEDGLISYSNKAFNEKVGKNLQGQLFYSNVLEREIPKLEKFINNILTHKNVSNNIVIDIVDKQNQRFLVDWDFKLLFEDDNVSIQCMGRDITELEDIKSELIHREQIYRMSSQIANIAYWEFNPKTNYVFWSNELFDILEYTKKQDLDIEFVKSLTHPDDVEVVFENLEFAKINKVEKTYKHRILNNNGKYLTMLATTRPLFINNEFISFIGITKDITAEEEKNILIRKNEQLYKATIDALSEGIVLQDKDDKIIMHNKAAENILGLSSDQLIGIDSYDPKWIAINENGDPLEGSKHPSVVTNKTGKAVRNFIMGIHRPDKTLVWILVNSEPVSFGDDGVVDATATSFTDISKMLKYQKEIAQKESQFRAIFDYSPNGTFVCDNNNNIVLLNKKARQIFEKEEHSLLGTSYDTLFIDDKNENEELISIINKEYDYYEVTRIAKDKFNNEKTLTITCTILWDEDNQVANILRIFNDITQITKATNELKEKNFLLNEMGYLSNTGAWEYYFETEEFVWSDSIYEIYGLEYGENIAGEIEDKYYHPDEIEKVKSDFDKLRQHNQIVDSTYRFIDAKGVNKIIRFKGKTISDSNHFPYKIVGILQDVTEIINKENEIRSKNISLTQLKNAINKSTIVAYTDLEGKITEVNEKFVEVYGYSTDEIVGKTTKFLASKSHNTEFWKNYWDIISKGHIWNGEFKNIKKDGSVVWLNATVFPLKDGNGNIIQYLEILTDITLNKIYQESLEHTVEERTIELKEANNEKDFILQMVSHDLKNPLTGILLQSEIIKRYSMKNSDDYLLEKVNFLIDNTKRMNLIINNLLEFESINSQEHRLITEINLNNLINSFKSAYKERLKIKNQELEIILPNEEIIIKSNKDYLFQIIDNLISNASKFSNQGKKITIEVSVNSDICSIKIKDEGPGISDEDKPKVFKKFVKLSNKPTGNENTSGLGLSIVKKLCDLIGHKISFESELNKGTVFSVDIKV